MAGERRTVEEILRELASRSHGVVTRRELLQAGVSTAALIRVHRGVYRVGHQAPSLLARYIAAVKACGEGSLLFRRAAAHLLGLVKAPPSLPEVLCLTQRRVRGVRTQRRRRTEAVDGTAWRAIPVTTVQRTLVDLAAVLDEDELALAVHHADARHQVRPEQIEEVLARRHNWPGARKLRRVIWGEVPVALSRLEARFLTRLREGGLPLPETNRRVDGRYVDCRWPEQWLTVELDSYRYHRTRHVWEQDRQRERETRARGDEFRRYTWRDVEEKPEAMLADLRQLLGRLMFQERGH